MKEVFTFLKKLCLKIIYYTIDLTEICNSTFYFHNNLVKEYKCSYCLHPFELNYYI